MKMKKFILSLFASLLFTTALWAQSTTSNPADAKVKFVKETIDFGKTDLNKPVTVDFEFTNISKEPVVIETARASCGCTTPKWTQEPIAPGKKGKVTASYSANGLGQQNKTIWVKFRGVDQDKELHLTGTVGGANNK
ncbi:Protein of unknown function [Chitinophaga terrae (ex Kim and Jung 2007)]|jgi:hypothetical protein|uniref:DUF1573 domain-containing protein n=2 Tax=Chitinophaga terrae (ex Kim and Jung 2007) TaxID=408074 RepID=A0A1H4A940_9BACT|nr:hypothetical protein CTE07_17470 [Chitinophaga terrae (ex Kim and Jung 2007)]SEA32201.1 Protein of unknown function [Chitinophaga terrae (ex Kim and Jung 2007)]